jgi:uncharacterized membrane protein
MLMSSPFEKTPAGGRVRGRPDYFRALTGGKREAAARAHPRPHADGSHKLPSVSFDDWVLALHVLSAFAYVGGIVLFWILVVAVRKTDTAAGTIRMEPIVKVGNVAVGIGAIGTIVLGIWLAFSVGDYAIWDGWIIAALVLWAIGGAIGQRTGAAYMQGMTKAKELEGAGQTGSNAELLALNRTSNGLLFQSLASIVLLLLLLDMIFKPGA